MMKKLTIATFMALLTLVLVLPAMAAPKGQGQAGAQKQGVEQGQNQAAANKNAATESKGRQLHKAYFENLDKRMQRRDQAMQMRMQLIKENNPGNTGM
jgi:ABC-type oligopeptide transport system substrate-binding subunit